MVLPNATARLVIAWRAPTQADLNAGDIVVNAADGSAWTKLLSNQVVLLGGRAVGFTSTDGSSSEYELPIASPSVLGGVKVGANLQITADGLLSAIHPPAYVLPVAGPAVLGGVKIGAGLAITAEGVLSTSGGTSTPGSLTPGNWLSGSAFNGGANVTWNVVAATTATANQLAARDGAGALFATTFHGPLNGNASTATRLQTARTINGVPFDGSTNITVTDATRLLKAGDTMTGNLNMAPGTYVVLMDTAEVVSNPRPRGRNFLWMRTASDDIASMAFDADGRLDVYGNRGVRILPEWGEVSLWPNGAESYVFGGWGALFRRILYLQREAAGPALVVAADTQAGDNARALVQFTSRDFQQQWATIESRNFRTDYTGRDQCWIRAGTEVTTSAVFLSGGWQSGIVLRILRGDTQIAYINSAGDYVKGMALKAPEALPADAPPLDRVAPLLTGADIVTEDEEGIWVNESAVIAALVQEVRDLTARVHRLESAQGGSTEGT